MVLTPTRLDFSNLKVGMSSAAQTLTIANTGTVSLTVGNVAVTGAAQDDYRVVMDGCTGMIVNPDASCGLKVVFAPPIIGTRLGRVTVPNDAPTSPDVAALVGSSIAADEIFSNSGE